jgi:hypothetical protein
MITPADHIDALSMLIATAPDKTPDAGEATIRAWVDYTDRFPAWTGDEWVAAAGELNQRPRERLVQPSDLGEIVKMWRRDARERMDPEERPYADLGGGAPVPPGVRRDRHGYVDKSDPADDEHYPADWTTEQRLEAYWARVNAYRDGREYRQATDAFPTLLETPPATAEQRIAAIQSFANRQRAFDDPDDEEIPYVNPLLVACGFCKAPPGDRCTVWGLPGRPREKLTKIPAHPMRIKAAALAAGFTGERADALVDALMRRQGRLARAEWGDRDVPTPVPTGAAPTNGVQTTAEASHDE